MRFYGPQYWGLMPVGLRHRRQFPRETLGIRSPKQCLGETSDENMEQLVCLSRMPDSPADLCAMLIPQHAKRALKVKGIKGQVL